MAKVTVTYQLNEGYTMDETHLYIGNDKFPKKNGQYTVAPGQYPYSHALDDATTDTYELTVNNLCSQKIYVIAHAVTCWYK